MKNFLLIMLFTLKVVLISLPIIGLLALTSILMTLVNPWFGLLLILAIPSIALSIFLAFILDPVDSLVDSLEY